MKKLADRLSQLSVSETFAMAEKSAQLRRAGLDIVNLTLGEPDFNTPDRIKNAAREAIEKNITKYSEVAGFPELRKAVSEKFLRENGLSYPPEQIIISNGAKQSLANVLMALVNPGDEVIIIAPYWTTYLALVRLLGGEPVIIDTRVEEDYKASAGQIQKAITPRTRVLILNSPSNPAGSVYSVGELEEVARVVAGANDLFVVSDEIYEHLNYIGKHESIARFDFLKERVIVINGVSKGYAMTGWRIGYMAAPGWIAEACSIIQGHTTSGAGSISQMAAITALSSDFVLPGEMKNIYQGRRDLVVGYLKKIPGMKINNPSGTFYILPDIAEYLGKKSGDRTIQTDADLCMYLLEQAHVALVPGDAFGKGNCVRISFATSEERLVLGMERITRGLQDLR